MLLTHIPRKAHSMRTHVHTTVKQSLTAQIERLVQASFNMSPTPDISFVSVVTHSGFAASESYQNPLLSTPCITPLCNRCQSLFHLDLGQDLDRRVPRKGSCKQGNRSKGSGSRTNCRHKISLQRNFCQQPPPAHNRKHLACISLEKEISLVAG